MDVTENDSPCRMLTSIDKYIWECLYIKTGQNSKKNMYWSI
jgi:hypothetical protein